MGAVSTALVGVAGGLLQARAQRVFPRNAPATVDHALQKGFARKHLAVDAVSYLHLVQHWIDHLPSTLVWAGRC